MSDQHSDIAMDGEATTHDPKGKGKAVDDAQDMSMDDDEESSEDEVAEEPHGDEELEDNMDEIDTGNIIPDGRRTRGKTIDYAKAAEDAKNAGEDLDDEEEDDDDFEEKEDREHDEDDVMRD